jgi:hypothetical protein
MTATASNPLPSISVTMPVAWEFTKWLERNGGSPAEMSRRRRIKEILGMPT